MIEVNQISGVFLTNLRGFLKNLGSENVIHDDEMPVIARELSAGSDTATIGMVLMVQRRALDR